MTAHPNGVWIWELSKLRPDYLDKLVERKVKRVYLKVFDGKSRPMFWRDQCSPEIIQQFQSREIQVYGWGFHYGTSNITEQVSAVKDAMNCGLDGYIVDMEDSVKDESTHLYVDKLLFHLRPLIQEGSFGYTSFGHPGFHPEIPWKILDQYCDIALPQIYFEKFGFRRTSEEEVQDCLKAHQEKGLTKPILPIWGSEHDTREPASARELQSYLNRYPGSSIWRLPHLNERSEAWNLNYAGQQIIQVGSSSQPSDFKLPTLTRFLKNGMIGEDVKALQTALNALGYNSGEVDGDFGSQTEAAVKAFQTKAGITIDGEVGPQTWKELGGKSAEPFDLPEQLLAKLANFAEDEAAKNLVWDGASSQAEKYLTIFREPMRKKGHIGRDPIFYDWCAGFVTYCCRSMGIQIPDEPETGFWATMALVESWKFWAKKNGYWYHRDSITPKRGDILVFDWPGTDPALDHIGIVRGYTPGSSLIQTAEGNKNNQSGNFTRDMSNVAGFIRIM